MHVRDRAPSPSLPRQVNPAIASKALSMLPAMEVLCLSDRIRELVASRASEMSKIMLEVNEASWLADTLGDADRRRDAMEAKRRLAAMFSDSGDYELLRAAPNQEDPLLARQVDILTRTYAKYQATATEVEEQSELERQINDVFVSFRADLDGIAASENDINEVLASEHDSTRRRRAWEASKQIGKRVAPLLIELVEARNRAARRLGYRDYYAMSLSLDEIDESDLFSLIDQLARATDGLFAAEKAKIDHSLAARFGVDAHNIGPWHYADPFFQRAPDDGSVDLDPVFRGKHLPTLARKFYSILDMDVDDILARSDLYERPGKYQHAYCTDIDREGDIRTICNLRDNHEWMSTLLHELGHGVYFKYVRRDLPWLLREHAHSLTTEAVATVMGDQVFDAGWLMKVAGVGDAEAHAVERAAARRSALQAMIAIRWCMVMAHFERALYADPGANLNALWWDLVRGYQLVEAPAGRDEPDWAAKIHLALYPVYYHNYLLGGLLCSQLQQAVEERTGTRSLALAPEAGQWLVEAVMEPGARWHWNELVRRATGRPLDEQAFVASLKLLES